jgi:hypothetical protein
MKYSALFHKPVPPPGCCALRAAHGIGIPTVSFRINRIHPAIIP